jgi:hypothetical protein
MPYLSFIDDQKLEGIVGEVLQKGFDARIKTDKAFSKNVIDPFSILFEMSSFSIGFGQWLENEKIRQAQKTLSNHIGSFHQNILGALEGWETLEGGVVDVISHGQKIIAEIKNKHNTVKGSDKYRMYQDLEDLVMRKGHIYKGYTAYYVEIVPNKPVPYNSNGSDFTPPDRRTGDNCKPNPLIQKIDGYNFYRLATGVDDALYQLFSVLPEVIAKIKPEGKIGEMEAAKEFFKKAYL